MPLDNFNTSEDSSGGPTRTTYFQFENPDHPDSKEFDDPEVAAEHFQAARYIQDRMGTNRHNLVGEFLSAVRTLEQDGDDEELQSFVQKLTS